MHNVNGVASGTLNRPHYGIDVSYKKGNKLSAIESGNMQYFPNAGQAGNIIRITTENGINYDYLHTSSNNDNMSYSNSLNGTQVKRGQIIGIGGNSGIGTGPHLHLNIWYELPDTPENRKNCKNKVFTPYGAYRYKCGQLRFYYNPKLYLEGQK